MPKLLRGLSFAGLMAVVTAAGALPRPSQLEPAIQFWKRIFTQLSSDEGLIHDARDLSIVYETVRFPADMGPRRQDKYVQHLQKRYSEALRRLAGHPDAPDSRLERQVRRLFPEHVTAATLREAAGDVRFQRGQSDKFRAGLKRSGRWLPYIHRILAQKGVPPELASLPHVESSFNPEARSHAGAAGMWQFTAGTGRRYLRVDQVLDQRLDPWRSTRAAADLLANNYSQLGTWPLAITAYNHGVAGMRRAVQEVGSTNIAAIIRRYDGPYFGFASRNFYPALLAAAEIDEHPEQYFGSVQRQSAAQVTEVTVPDYVPIAVLERHLKVSRKELKHLNPSLQDAVWDGRKFVPKGYRLRLPSGRDTAAVSRVVAAIPLSERYGEQRPDRFYRVRRGQTLSGIARRYGVSVHALVVANRLHSRNLVRAGMNLRLPLPGREPRPLASAGHGGDHDRYVVRHGDTLVDIARRFGVSAKDLAAINGIRNPDMIRPGQALKLAPQGDIAAAEVSDADGG